MSVKLYRHNESGEIVAAWENIHNCWIVFGKGIVHYENEKDFEHRYTPLPEAPEVGSTAWAWQMLEDGEKISHPTLDGGYLYLSEDNILMWSLHKCVFSSITQSLTDWQLYEAPKPIVECLPHEFVPGQEVLVRDNVSYKWAKKEFISYAKNLNTHRFRIRSGSDNIGFRYCIPYAGNEHLEGTITDGEHGAVPRGYVPPHVPQLGDETYWQKGDEVVDLAEFYRTRIITHVFENHIVTKHSEDSSLITYYTKNGCFIDASNMRDCGTLRVLYHDTSYVREDGTVHEHIPTRPHRIESCTTCDGTEDVESCAYCKDEG